MTEPRAETPLRRGHRCRRKGKPGADMALRPLSSTAPSPQSFEHALSLLPQFNGECHAGDDQGVSSGVSDTDPLVRTAAVDALAPFAPEQRLPVIALCSLIGPCRSHCGARLLAAHDPAADAPAAQPTWTRRGRIHRRPDGFRRPAGGARHPRAFYADRSQMDAAEAAYRTALRLDPSFVPPWSTLPISTQQQRDADGEPLLRQAVAIEPKNAVAHHASTASAARAAPRPGKSGTARSRTIYAEQCTLCLRICHWLHTAGQSARPAGPPIRPPDASPR